MPKVRIKQIEQIQASDIYLEKDLLITSKVGEIQAFDQGKNYATITAVKPDGSRKSLQNVLEEIFSKDSQPTVSNPKVTLMRHGVNGDTLDDDRYVEAGTIVEFGEIPLRFNQGSYQFGPDTQCEPLKAHFARVLNGEEASYENVDFDARTANLPAGSFWLQELRESCYGLASGSSRHRYQSRLSRKHHGSISDSLGCA